MTRRPVASDIHCISYTDDSKMKVKIAKWGNSAAVRLPKAALDATGLAPGTEVDVLVEGRDLVLRAARVFPRYTLGELVAEMDRLGPANEPEPIDWGPDRGAEIIDDEYTRASLASESGGSRMGRARTDARRRAKRRKTRGSAQRS